MSAAHAPLGATPAPIDSAGWKTTIDGRRFYTDGIGNVSVGGHWYAATKIHVVPHVNGASKAASFLRAKAPAGVGTNANCNQYCYELNDRSICYEVCTTEPPVSQHSFTAARGAFAGAPVRRFAAINSQLAPAPARGLGWCITPGDPWHCDRAGNPLPTPHGGDPHPSLDNPKPYQPPGGGVGASSGSDVECYPVEGDDNRIVCAPVPAPPGNDVRFSVAQHRR